MWKYVDFKVQLFEYLIPPKCIQNNGRCFITSGYCTFSTVYVQPKVGINNEDAFWPEIATQTIMYLVFFQQMHSTLLFCLIAKHPKD